MGWPDVSIDKKGQARRSIGFSFNGKFISGYENLLSGGQSRAMTANPIFWKHGEDFVSGPQVAEDLREWGKKQV